MYTDMVFMDEMNKLLIRFGSVTLLPQHSSLSLDYKLITVVGVLEIILMDLLWTHQMEKYIYGLVIDTIIRIESGTVRNLPHYNLFFYCSFEECGCGDRKIYETSLQTSVKAKMDANDLSWVYPYMLLSYFLIHLRICYHFFLQNVALSKDFTMFKKS